MKIIRTASDVSKSKSDRVSANVGCNTCPCCGETRQWDYRLSGRPAGISPPLVARVNIGNFWMTRYASVDFYECYTCGAEWESDPYDIS